MAKKTSKKAEKVEDAPVESPTQTETSAPEKAANAPSIAVGGVGSVIKIQNLSRNIRTIPLNKDRRETILPGQTWTVPDEHVETIRKALQTPYYRSLVDQKFIKIHEVEPSRLGEPEFKTPKTPEPPKDLTETASSVTQAEFLKQDDDE